MFSFIKNYSERRRLKRLFSKSVSPKVVEELSAGTFDFGKLDERFFDVVMLLVGGSAPVKVSENIATVTELAHAHHAEYDAITGGLMIYCFGKCPTEKADKVRRLAFVEAACAKLGNDVKIVHGAGTGQVGLFGSEAYILTYTILMPGYAQALGTLVYLADGEVKEVPFS